MCLLSWVGLMWSPCSAIFSLCNVRRTTTFCGLPLHVGVHLMSFLYLILDATLLALFAIWAVHLPLQDLRQSRSWAGSSAVLTQVKTELKKQLLPIEYPLVTTLTVLYATWVFLDIVAIVGYALSCTAALTAWALLTAFRFLHCPVDVTLVTLICTVNSDKCLKIIYPNIISLCTLILLPFARSLMSSHALETKNPVPNAETSTDGDPQTVSNPVTKSEHEQRSKQDSIKVNERITSTPSHASRRTLPSGVVHSFSSDSEFEARNNPFSRGIFIRYPFDIPGEFPVHTLFTPATTLQRVMNEAKMRDEATNTGMSRGASQSKVNVLCGVSNVCETGNNEFYRSPIRDARQRSIFAGTVKHVATQRTPNPSATARHTALDLHSKPVSDVFRTLHSAGRERQRISIVEHGVPHAPYSRGVVSAGSVSRRTPANKTMENRPPSRRSSISPVGHGVDASAGPSPKRPSTTCSGSPSKRNETIRKIIHAKLQKNENGGKSGTNVPKQDITFTAQRPDSSRDKQTAVLRKRMKKSARPMPKHKIIRPQPQMKNRFAGYNNESMYKGPRQPRPLLVSRKSIGNRATSAMIKSASMWSAIQHEEVEDHSILGDLTTIMSPISASLEDVVGSNSLGGGSVTVTTKPLAECGAGRRDNQMGRPNIQPVNLDSFFGYN